MTKVIPVLLLTGYLGSGKTTLVNHILRNEQGIKFAVIVNDIGEVNIDADFIQRTGVVDMADDSLVSLQNGCICCTLQNDLIEQIYNLISSEKFDYIVIEASGICDPAPIAQTIWSIPRMGGAYVRHGTCVLDNIVTVVDALRIRDEFSGGDRLTQNDLEENDIESLLIQQIEFCNMILLNKVSEVTPDELEHIRHIIRALQPKAEIIETDYAKVDLNKLLNTKLFDLRAVATSASWVEEFSKDPNKAHEEEEHHHEEEEQEHHHHEHEEHDHEHHHEHEEHDHEHHHDGHCGHCHHHHHGEGGHAAEFGISTFVYYRRFPFDPNKFDWFATKGWPKGIIRTKGVCYFKDEMNMSYIFEQAGQQKLLTKAGNWYATLSEAKRREAFQTVPGLADDWDKTYGDRMQKLVFIGQNMDREEIENLLDICLTE